MKHLVIITTTLLMICCGPPPSALPDRAAKTTQTEKLSESEKNSVTAASKPLSPSQKESTKEPLCSLDVSAYYKTASPLILSEATCTHTILPLLHINSETIVEIEKQSSLFAVSNRAVSHDWLVKLGKPEQLVMIDLVHGHILEGYRFDQRSSTLVQIPLDEEPSIAPRFFFDVSRAVPETLNISDGSDSFVQESIIPSQKLLIMQYGYLV